MSEQEEKERHGISSPFMLGGLAVVLGGMLLYAVIKNGHRDRISSTLDFLNGMMAAGSDQICALIEEANALPGLNGIFYKESDKVVFLKPVT